MHGQAVQLAGEADGKVADVDHLLDFAFAFGADFSHFPTDQRAEFFLYFAEGVAELAYGFAARGGGHGAPFQEGRVRAVDDAAVFVHRHLFDRSDHLAVDG